ncbi:hypothetical protein LXJ15735_34860 [Lacrimispora xylanolytica]|nr:helix-turn-helix transcriptional regulator [Clostridiales bacterium]
MGDFLVLAQRIKELRNKMGKTQREFSGIVGCTAATLSAYENGSKSPSLEIVKNIAEKCHVSIDWLCGLTDKTNTEDNIETYSDIIELLLKLSSIELAPEGSFFFIYNEDTSNPILNYAGLRTFDSKLKTFIKDYIQMKNLLDNNTIDKHLYDLWLKDKLKEYDTKFSTWNSII